MNYKSFFLFCDYKEKNFYEKIYNFIYRNSISLMTNNKKQIYSSFLLMNVLKYVIVMLILLSGAISYIYYGNLWDYYFFLLKNWCQLKLKQCKFNLNNIFIKIIKKTILKR